MISVASAKISTDNFGSKVRVDFSDFSNLDQSNKSNRVTAIYSG